MLPDAHEHPFITVEEGGRFCGLGRSKSYEQARRYLATGGAEGLPCVSFGRTLRVPVAALLRLAQIDTEREDAGPDQAGASITTLDPRQKVDVVDGQRTPAARR